MANPLVSYAVQACLKSQAKAIEHIRGCTRCAQLLSAAFEVADESQVHTLITESWFLIGRLLGELRWCDGWPRGA
jgi:hypothetical protein